MDEDDSQDELINRSSKSKGKRAAEWAISDDSDEAGSDEEVESQSGEEDDTLDDEEDEDEDEEDEVVSKEEGCAGTSADAEVSSDEEAEKCPICLHSFNSQPVATPENCEHYFCLDCILEWSKNANSCPIDRTNFKVIYLRTCFGGKVQKAITVQKPAKQCEQETVDVDLEETSCEVCGGSDHEDRLLLCDGCDAGYHMECLTPPLDAVPVEEWFCPECESNNRQSRASATETSDADSLPSTARHASSRPRSQVGQTRHIARTQHSERVRANVNRHRITQARTQELAPTYLIRSTWLDETINAVVAGLNTAVYVRDLTSRPSSTRRRKSRKVHGRKTSKSKKGKSASTGGKRRKRRVRRTKSRKKLVIKKTPRSRIANNLGIVKDKKSSSLPTVYRPSESTLSSMRADIGAASLSIYGDPFDLDPFTDREDEEEQTHDSALFEAKRRGISRSAFRSHQPVARPVSLSRRPVSIPQASSVVEAAPVPDLLGSILSGQSMLLMDSSDVVINRDGSLKASKPIGLTNPMSSRSSSAGDSGSQTTDVDRLGSSESPMNTNFSQSSSPLSPPLGSPLNPSEMSYAHVPPRSNAFSHELIRPNQRLGHPITNGIRECRDGSSSESKTVSQSHSLKAPTKPMWVDVSVLPRIPKIKREGNVNTSMKNDSNTSRSSNGSSYGMPETGINRLAGDKERRHSVDQQHGRTDGPRSRPDGAGSSSGFSSSFSSSSPAPHTNHQRFSSGGSSSSSSVSFRISSSGNSWHSRRLNIASLTPSGSSLQDHCSKKEEEERKRQLRRDKQKLLASRSKDSNNIYDPFNPTESDSGSSDGESQGINTATDCSSRLKQEPASLKKKVVSRSRWDLKQGKNETERPHSQNKPATTTAQETCTEQLKGTKNNITFKKGSIFSHIEMPTPSNTPIKKEPASDTDEAVKRVFKSETEDEAQPMEQRLNIIKTEEAVTEGPAPEPPTALCDDGASATSHSSPVKNSEKTEIKYDLHNKNQSKESVSDKSTSKKKEPSKDLRARSRSTERAKKHSRPEQDQRHVRTEAKHEGVEKEKDKDKAKSSRRSRSKERRTTRRASESSSSKSPEKASKKRRRSRSRSKDKRRSRSCSTSSSRERSRTKKHKRRSKERDEDKDLKRRSSKDKRRDRSRSKSRSKSRSRSRSRSRERRRARSKSRSRSRSRSRDRRKNESRHLSSRDKVDSRSKDKRRHRSRSTSRERKKTREDLSTVKKPKNADTSRSSDKDKKFVKDKRKDDILTVKSEKLGKSEKCVKSEKDDTVEKAGKSEKCFKSEKDDTVEKAGKAEKYVKSEKDDTVEKAGKAEKCFKSEKDDAVEKAGKFEKMTKPSSSSSISSLVVKEPAEKKVEENPCETVDKKDKIKKEIKKEKCAVFDMFEGSPTSNIIKQEPVDTPVVVDEVKEKEDADSIQTEECQSDKPEAKSPEEKPIVSDCSIDDDIHTTAVSTPPQDPPDQSTESPTISIKQEAVHPSSDSDDDFNVDVMLDNLDLVKSKCDESTEATVKQEKDEKCEGETVAAVGKAKPQVKRVTWNIEEPVGPQPDKSASKVALYKLKLKQEGIRRPSASMSSQDLIGTASAGDVTKSTDPERSSVSDSLQGPPASTQGQGEYGDVLKKDKTYLKKLHMQERAIEEVKLAIKPFYQKRDINKDEYKEILRKAVQKVCHSKSGEINPVKVGNLVKAYVDKYKHARKYKKGDEPGKTQELLRTTDSP